MSAKVVQLTLKEWKSWAKHLASVEEAAELSSKRVLKAAGQVGRKAEKAAGETAKVSEKASSRSAKADEALGKAGQESGSKVKAQADDLGKSGTQTGDDIAEAAGDAEKAAGKSERTAAEQVEDFKQQYGLGSTGSRIGADAGVAASNGMKSWQNFALGMYERTSGKGLLIGGTVLAGLATGRGALGVASYQLLGTDVVKNGVVPTVAHMTFGPEADGHSVGGATVNALMGEGTSDRIKRGVDETGDAIRRSGLKVAEYAHRGKEKVEDMLSGASDLSAETAPMEMPAGYELTDREAYLVQCLQEQQRQLRQYEQYASSPLAQQSAGGNVPMFDSVGKGFGDLLGGLYNNKGKALDIGGLIAAAWMFMGKHNFLVKIAGLLLGSYSLKSYQNNARTENAAYSVSQSYGNGRQQPTRDEVESAMRSNYDRMDGDRRQEEHQRRPGIVYRTA